MKSCVVLLIIVLFGCQRFSRSAEQPLENTLWKLKTIFLKGHTYNYSLNKDSAIFMHFGKLKKKRHALLGEFTIFNNEKDINSKNYFYPFRGYYVMKSEKIEKVRIGWYPNKSYNPYMYHTEMGRIIRDAFFVNNGSYFISTGSMTVYANDSDRIAFERE
jgi:hypothetical protein